jgi:hypothetical protein
MRKCSILIALFAALSLAGLAAEDRVVLESTSATYTISAEGKNQVRFSCSSRKGPAPRVKVTVFTQGEDL